MRKTTATQIALMTLFAAAPLCAQRGDPTTKVDGTGKLPAGWMVRFDPPRGSQPVPPLSAVSFVSAGTGFHVTSGPAALYYNTKDVASGEYSVSATFKQTKSMMHEAFGLFIGGANLQDSTQNYLYFVIKPWDGSMLISHRSSNGKPVALSPSAPEVAVSKDAPADGSATNAMTIHVAKDTVHFILNGKVVKALAKTQLDGASTNGIVGLRINHNIDMQIDGWTGVKKQ